MKVIKAPNDYPTDEPLIFLAGSIEMGKATMWQDEFSELMSRVPGTILNPRRDDWDSSWVQSKDNPQFFKQVSWELAGLEEADLICMYFEPGTVAPISLLEFGLHASQTEMIVCCPEGFFRKGNVDIVCERYGVQQVETVPAMAVRAESRINVLAP